MALRAIIVRSPARGSSGYYLVFWRIGGQLVAQRLLARVFQGIVAPPIGHTAISYERQLDFLAVG